MPSSGKLIVYTDGASRGNPGRAAGGISVCNENGEEVLALSRRFGEATNNQAEYRAFLVGLEEAKRLGATRIEVRADSELLVRQINGQYRVKDEKLKPLFLKARKMLETEFDSFEVCHVARENNWRADQLANQALDGN